MTAAQGARAGQPDHSISALAAMTGGDGFEYEVVEDDPSNPYPQRDRMVAGEDGSLLFQPSVALMKTSQILAPGPHS